MSVLLIIAWKTLYESLKPSVLLSPALSLTFLVVLALVRLIEA